MKAKNLESELPSSSWTYLTNHAHVLIVLAGNPKITMREISERVGITERAVQMIISDLVSDGVVERIRRGRRNEYKIHGGRRLRHPVESHRTVDDLLRLIMEEDGSA